MKKMLIGALCTLILTTTVFAESLETVVKAAMDHMKTEGYTTEKIHEDGDFTVKYEGRTYVVIFDSNDPLYVSIQLAFKESYSGTELAKAQSVANATMRAKKAIKVCLNKNNDVVFRAEFFMARADDFGPLSKRLVSAIQSSRAHFYDNMK